MQMPDFTLEFIKDIAASKRLAKTLVSLSNFALDIETSDWWNRHRERIALVQIAFRTERRIKVAIIDPLENFEMEFLRRPLEQSSVVKIIHNAGFDAVRLEKHYKFNTVSIFDTMAAARRSGERKYSLKAQAEIHLNLRLDKSMQTSDWSRRPLNTRQLYYAALDACATLLLYENQLQRNLNGEYRLKTPPDPVQNLLPLGKFSPALKSINPADAPPGKSASRAGSVLQAKFFPPFELSTVAAALLGIITELPTRFNPDSLAASAGSERAGLAGWIIDRRLGVDAEPDEGAVREAIADLCENGLIRTTETRRLEATPAGAKMWGTLKSNGSEDT
jgi:hypothetical protein